jgi:hypothetical protein
MEQDTTNQRSCTPNACSDDATGSPYAPEKRPKGQTFPRMRKSQSAQQSFTEEVNRLHGMSIEERVLEALGMNQRFSWLNPTPRDP